MSIWRCMCLPLRILNTFGSRFWGSDLYSWINWRPKWAVFTTVIPHKYVYLTPLDFGSMTLINEWILLYYSSPTTGAQSGDHYCWRYSGCSIQGPWHVESCSSVGNSGLWSGGFVLRGLWGQRGASTGTFTKHEVNKRWRMQNQLSICLLGSWFLCFSFYE